MARVSATRSPLRAATFSWPMMAARLSRADRVTRALPRVRPPARRAPPSLGRHVVLFAVIGRHALDGDLAVDERAQPLERVAPLRLDVVRGVGMDSDHDRFTAALRRPRLDLAEDLGGQGRVGLDDAAAATGGTGRVEERLQALAHALARHLDQSQLRDLEDVRARLV